MIRIEGPQHVRVQGQLPDIAPGNVLDAALTAIARLGLEPAPRILITGSLYLAGEALAANGTELL